MKAAEFPVYSVGCPVSLPPDHGYIILQAETSSAVLDGVCEWLETSPRATLAVIARRGDETYAP
jgi:hypothetical protein